MLRLGGVPDSDRSWKPCKMPRLSFGSPGHPRSPRSGFFNANAAHPYENANAISNMLEIWVTRCRRLPFGTWHQQLAGYRDFLASAGLMLSEVGIKARLTGRGYGCRRRCLLSQLASDSNLAFWDGDHSKKP